MKKFLFTMACMLGMSMTASANTNSVVFLLHNDKITSYEPNKINDAVKAAANGDVIMLSEGTYPGFTITKKITVRGVGNNMTIIDGDIDINIPNEPTLTANLLEYLRIEGNVNVKSSIRGMTIKQCKVSVIIQAKVNDSYIDRCEIGYLELSRTYDETITVDGVTKTITTPYVQGLTITNSLINHARGVCSSKMSPGSTFLNCKIRGCYSMGSIINSINKAIYYEITCTNFINTYIADGGFQEETCTLTNCYFGDEELAYDSEDIAKNGYLGQDGTIIGPLGGNTPYTLVPSAPHVTDMTLKVDTKKKKLNATLTVSPK